MWMVPDSLPRGRAGATLAKQSTSPGLRHSVSTLRHNSGDVLRTFPVNAPLVPLVPAANLWAWLPLRWWEKQ